MEENHLFAFLMTNYFCNSDGVSLNLLSFISSPVRPLNYSTFSASFCFKHFNENLGRIGFFDIWCPLHPVLDMIHFFGWKKLQNSLPGMLEAQSIFHAPPFLWRALQPLHPHSCHCDREMATTQPPDTNVLQEKMRSKRSFGGFLCGPVVKNLFCKKEKKNLPCEARCMGSIPGWGTKIPHATQSN